MSEFRRSLNEADLKTKIPGWGADLENRVGEPKEQPAHPANGSHWMQPPAQRPKVKINLSASRQAMTPVMGTTLPPKGLSGIIRNYAYTMTEVRPTHWLLLMAADRVDVVEGKISDFVFGQADESGKVPTSPRPAVVVAGIGALAMGAIFLIHRHGEKKKSVFKNKQLTRKSATNHRPLHEKETASAGHPARH